MDRSELEMPELSDVETDFGYEESEEEDNGMLEYNDLGAGADDGPPQYNDLGAGDDDGPPQYTSCSAGADEGPSSPKFRSLGDELVAAPPRVQRRGGGPPRLTDFVKYGMMWAGDVMQYLVKSDAGTKLLIATLGKHPDMGWRLLVHLAELGDEETQRDTIRICCATSKYERWSST